MDNKRPTGRQKNVTSGSSSVNKKGSGLGTGPVGNVSSHSNQGGSSNMARAGVGGGSIAVVIIIIVLKFVLGGGSGATSTTPNVDFSNPESSAVATSSYSKEVDTTVAEGSRAKRTVINGNGEDTVTIMVYMCGTDLESRGGMASSDINEMLGAKLSDKVNLILYTGGCKAWKNDVISSQVNQIYQVKDGKLNLLEKDMGDKKMVDPATLTGFIKYCNTNFPANRNELIFWDHGGGSLTGYGYDEKYASAGSMNLSGINKALSDSGMKFDFIGFDACLMATLENGLMIEQYADYLIASEETEPGVGWYYTNWLTEFSKDTSMATVNVGKIIVDDFIDVCAQKCKGQKTTLSVVDLAELKNTVPNELTEFAKSTNDIIKNDDYKKVSKARNNTREFAQSSKIDQIDLVNFCDNLGTSEASELAKALKGAVKYNRTASNMTNSNGISIYFPYQKTKNVTNAVNLFNNIGMDSEYSKCIKEFAAVETAGQVSAGGQASPLSSLLGAEIGGGSVSSSSGGSADLITSMLGSLASSGAESFGLDSSILGLFTDREISNDQTAEYISNNYFDANDLVWVNNKLSLSEDKWELVADLELNVFVDDGSGYIDLGMDNVFEYDEDGALIGEYDGTWLAIDGQIVPYYHETTIDDDDTYCITGYVPCMLNGTRVELLLTFDSDNPNGYISGARYVYKDGETEAVAKSEIEVKEGDKIEPICDYYSYDGVYQDSYMMDATITLSASPVISNVKIDGSNYRASYRFSDIYNQYYWTPVIP